MKSEFLDSLPATNHPNNPKHRHNHHPNPHRKPTPTNPNPQTTFPTKYNQLLTTAQYMLCEGNTLSYIQDWIDQTKTTTPNLTDTQTSKLFANITPQEKNEFFTQWIASQKDKEHHAYDVTSFSTHSNNLDLAEWGYNRDHDNLPQINLGLYYGITSHTPVYYALYNGSIPDKTYLEFIMTSAKKLGLNAINLILDRIFVTEANFNYLHQNGYNFITALAASRVETKTLIDTYRAEVRKSANYIGQYEVYGLKQPVMLYGRKLWAHIYFDAQKQAFDEKVIYVRIERLRGELEAMGQPKAVARGFLDYFVVDAQLEGDVRYGLDEGLVDGCLGRAGFFILLSSQESLSSSEVLGLYW